MQLKPEQLETHLASELAGSYLVSGDEPLLVQECADAIRRTAREHGCAERQRIHITGKDDWLELGHSAGSLSLFADRKLIEVSLPSGKPGAEGSKALQDFLAGNSDDVLLIVSAKIDKQSQKSKWPRECKAQGYQWIERPLLCSLKEWRATCWQRHKK
jgi:DNA polymerase-3 subunit delta